MGKPMQYQSLEKLINQYLIQEGITLEQHIFEGHRAKLTKREFSKNLADHIYERKGKIHDLIGERAQS